MAPHVYPWDEHFYFCNSYLRFQLDHCDLIILITDANGMLLIYDSHMNYFTIEVRNMIILIYHLNDHGNTTNCNGHQTSIYRLCIGIYCISYTFAPEPEHGTRLVLPDSAG